MNNALVKYKNELNTVPFKRFSPREMNLFFSIVSRMRDKGTDTVTFTFDELRGLSSYKQHSKQFITDLRNTYRKMQQLNIYIDTEDIFKSWVLFPTFEINRTEETVNIAVHPDLKGVLNEFTKENWTRFSLEEFNDLKSTYSKTMFRLIKQYRTSGWLYISAEDFRSLLDVPKSYTTSSIQNRVIKPILKELTPIFKGFKIAKKKSKKRGNKILGYRFTWYPEAKNKDDFKSTAWNELQKKVKNILGSENFSQTDKDSMIEALYKQYGFNKQKSKSLNQNEDRQNHDTDKEEIRKDIKRMLEEIKQEK